MVYHSAHNCKKLTMIKTLSSEQTDSVYTLAIYPTYSVISKQRPRGIASLSLLQVMNMANLREPKKIINIEKIKLTESSELSRKASRRLTNSVNWLVASAKQKHIYSKNHSKSFEFKINFITLTLPSTDHNISDSFFRNTLLRTFINTARYKFNLQNYVWKVESQANGNIHAHFTTDVYMNHKELRNCWNKILSNHGLINSYTNKFKHMTETDYINYFKKNRKINIDTLKKRYAAGVSCNWNSPNTTDVHAVSKIKDVAAYMAKYMSKTDKSRRSIKGRIWASSYSLSDKNKLVFEMFGGIDSDLLAELFVPGVTYAPITTISKLTNKLFKVADIFYYKISDWGSILKGRLLELFCNHRDSIRHSFPVIPHNLDIPKEYKLTF